MNQKINLKKMVLTSLFTALTCLATSLIKIETPITNGYINIGDGFVLLGAWVLGPVYGAFAGGVGSALSDALGGYVHYIPGTLIVKALIAVIAALLYHALRKRNAYLGQLVGGVAAELWMVLGYFVYASLILGKGLAAAMSIPGNLLQGTVGIFIAMALYIALQGSKILDKVNANG